MPRLLLLALLALAHPGAAQDADGLPLGLGIAQPTALSAERPLYFFASATANAPLDSLTLSEGPHHVEIATAPPWLDPEVAMLDGDYLAFRVVALRRDRVEVLVHDADVRWPPTTMWLDRSAVAFTSWAAYLLDVFSIETAEPAPIHATPGGEVTGTTEAGRPLYVREVRGAWAYVEDADGGEAPPLGWVRWRGPATDAGERLLVRYSVRS